MGRRQDAYIFAPEKTRRHGPGCLILGLAVIFAAIVLSLLTNAAMNRNLELRTEKVPVMSLDKTYEGFTLLHISDLHADEMGYDLTKWRELLYGKRFSAAVLTGDMVGASGDYGPMLALVKALQQINADAPVYFVAGDDDPTPILATLHGSPEVLCEWVSMLQQAGAIYLDAPVAQQVGKKNVWFVPEYLYSVDVAGMQSSLTRQKEEMEQTGVQYEGEGGASYRALCYRLDAMERTIAALKQMTAADLQIGVTHVPLEADYVRTMLEWADETAVFNFRNLSLVLAGHYVGGQWRLGGLGPVYVPEKGWFVGDAGVTGMQRINSINQHISGGLGASGFYPMPGRLFNTPNVTLLTFTAKIQ